MIARLGGGQRRAGRLGLDERTQGFRRNAALGDHRAAAVAPGNDGKRQAVAPGMQLRGLDQLMHQSPAHLAGAEDDEGDAFHGTTLANHAETDA